jgi:hypothetical protein
MSVVPIIGDKVTRVCVGGPWDGRAVPTPAIQDTMRVPNARPPEKAPGAGPLDAAALLADSTTYELCILRFPTARVEVWHPAGTEIVATVARLAHCYVPAADLRLVMAKVALLEAECQRLRDAAERASRMPCYGDDVTVPQRN